MKRFIPLFLILFIPCTIPLHAQSWQWGKRGGSDGNFSVSPGEFVKDMATDRNGNIYVLANAGDISGIDIAGQTKSGFSGYDVILASFRCNGTLRWVKIMGGRYSDGGFAVCTDKANGVYVSVGLMRNLDARPVYIDSDTAITDNKQKLLYLIKYDTSGNLKWVRSPQSDTVTATEQAIVIDMSVDSIGNIYALCQLPGGEYGGTGGFVVTPTFTSNGHSYADCMLKYDRNGNFLGGFNWDTKGAWGAKVTRDAKTEKYYLAATVGGAPLALGNTSIPAGNGYIACFDKDGKYQWDVHSDAARIYGRPVVDAQNNLYLGGIILPPSSTNPGANFNGYVAGSDAKSNGSPFIVKIDANRNNVWATYGIGLSSAAFVAGVAMRNSGEIVLSGHSGSLKWPKYTLDSFVSLPNTGYRPYITRFNTQTGKVLGMTRLATDNTDAYSDLIIADGRNNILIGGEIKSALTVNGNTIYNSGGVNDWYVAKYGHNNCGCTNIPEPKFSFNRTSNTSVSFTYTGSSYSTIEWDFDDGKTSTTASPVHVYDSLGTYTVCVKVTNSCGDNTYCAVIPMWPAGINEIAEEKVRVYPNPAFDHLYLEGITNDMQIQMIDVTGRLVYEIKASGNNTMVDISNVSDGIYILCLTDQAGNRVIKRIVKSGSR